MAFSVLFLALVAIFGVAALTFLSIVLLHKRVRVTVGKGHNEVASVVFATVGVLYAVVLAFVVFAVWERFSETDNAVAGEAAQIVGAYRDTQELPEPLRTNQQRAFRQYVQVVRDDEWASHGKLKEHTTPDALNPLWRNLRAAAALPGADLPALDRAAQDLHDVEIARHDRHLSRESTLPWIFWPILILGWLFTMSFIVLFDMANVRLQGLLGALLAGTIVAMLFLVFALQQPFTGRVHVSKRPLDHALLQFHVIDMGD